MLNFLKIPLFAPVIHWASLTNPKLKCNLFAFVSFIVDPK